MRLRPPIALSQQGSGFCRRKETADVYRIQIADGSGAVREEPLDTLRNRKPGTAFHEILDLSLPIRRQGLDLFDQGLSVACMMAIPWHKAVAIDFEWKRAARAQGNTPGAVVHQS